MEKLEVKLSKHDTSSDGGCSEEFREELTEFLKKRIELLKNTRKALCLDEDHIGDKKSRKKERTAANISGISEKQLQVRVYGLFHFPV